MPPELAEWITPAILILGFFYLDRSISFGVPQSVA